MRRAVQLNRKLVLEHAVRVADGSGGQTESWADLGTVWASLTPGTGRERGSEFVTLSRVPYRIVVRAVPEGQPERPKPDQRFREGNRVFRISAVSEYDARSHYLLCHATEEVLA